MEQRIKKLLLPNECERIDKLEDKPILGRYYNVPCMVKERDDFIEISPVINIPHSDKKSGQLEVHYHTDYRFIKFDNNKNIENKDKRYKFGTYGRVSPENGYNLKWHILKCHNEEFEARDATPTDFIKESMKNKPKCIVNGKCPHKGMLLNKATSKDGIIRCPLHGLAFDASSGDLLTRL